ncbi:MAG: PH domain-containing protein [Anaerolineales bacterium]|nr:PH domain-containing protein [Anaerolineales bacterium]
MRKTYKLNQRWKFLLLGVSFLLIVFILIFTFVYLSEKQLIFLEFVLVKVILLGLLAFGTFSTEIAISPTGLTSVSFGRSKFIPWEDVKSIEINPLNFQIFAKLKTPNEIFAFSPFIADNPSDLLAELANYLPKEYFQKELYDFRLIKS